VTTAVLRWAAFVRQDALAAVSYRVHFTLSLLGLAVGTIPLYYVANALQPMMQESILGQGGHYFTFVVIGLATQQLVTASTDALPRAVREGIRTGTLEAIFSTPTSFPLLLAGMMSFRVLWALLQGLVVVGVALLLGATLVASKVPAALVLVALIVAAYLPFGMIAAALVLAFRTAGPFAAIVGTGSVLLGGVYYPTTVIPGWIEGVSSVIPLTYGLRALRRTLVEGLPLSASAGDVGMLLLLLSALSAVGLVALVHSFRYARKAGTLGQY